MRPAQLTHPDELKTLSVDEVVVRVYPLLKKGGLTRYPQRRRRVLENVPSVLAELAAEWERAPRLNGRPVSFGEYVAARLCAALHELDQKQHPHLCDDHRRYRPEREPLLLAEEEEAPLRAARTHDDPAALVIAKHTSQDELFQQAMDAAAIHAASQAGVFQARQRFNNGEIDTPYGLTRLLGGSREEARARSATAAFIQLESLRDKMTFEL